MSTSLESPPKISSFTSDHSSGGSIQDFVVVSPSNSFEQPCSSDSSTKVLQASGREASAKMFESDCRKEDEMLEKLIAVSKENDKLKETLKNNNITLQKYIKDFSDMQDSYKTNNETIKKEHQRAKQVVTKLRDHNRTLKEELKAAQLQITHEAKREKVAGLERENSFLKNEIKLLQEHIITVDKDLKDCEMPEGTSENWRLLLGSLASFNYQTGISQRNVESLAKEMSNQSLDGAESQCKSKINLEGRYAELETEKEILKVDLEKIRVEKLHVEQKLEEQKSEHEKLKKSFTQMKEEGEQTRQLLNEQYEANIQEQNQNQNLQSEVQKLTEELQLNYEGLAKKKEENETLSKKLAESQQQQESQKGTTAKGYNDDDDDDDAHKLCNEKYLALQEVYFKSEKKLNAMERRENDLCAFEKSFGEEKKQLEETKKQLEAELQRHSASFLEKTQQLHSELQQARDREETLQKHVNDLQEREENLQGQVLQLIKENDAMRIKIEKLTDLNTRRDTLYEERMKHMEKESKEKEKEKSGMIEMLQVQLGTVKEDRKKYLEQSRIIKVEHDRLAYQHEALMKEYDELLNSFNGTLEESKLKSHNTSAEIQSYKGQMDDMAVHIASAQEELSKKEAIISDMKTLIERLQDEAPVLKEQVSVYYNDFKAEREARERQHADLLNLQEQNRSLTRENAELQMELDNIMNNQQMAEMQRRHLTPQQASQSFNPDAFAAGFLRGRGETDQRGRYEWLQPPRGPEHRVQESSQPEEPFPCQFCRRNFPQFEELQNHVRHCPQNSNDDRLLCPMCENEFPDADTLQIHAQECRGRPDV